MPDGASIFETTGAWEDFATPSRDLRLLIAIDVVRGYPERVARRPERYAMPKDKSAADVKAELDSTLAGELATRKFAYTRTDGTPWELTLKDVVPGRYDVKLRDKSGRACIVRNVEVKAGKPYAFSIAENELTECTK